ncbi:hypothetical protein SAMN05216312_112174 [Cohnella sp. OV330]|uniref:hypothetical protein n=1 Tax=Cohnella sp. OV330 TaxID=1855288 RepID=UPI0008E5B5AF|nr:hypothetical protein [Cohnella sp. OV330]SFB54435.1 hypothetical protein SAMN05216312_112174 [Cohnella sp. OV330]
MKQARLYDQPEAFAEMMKRQLAESLQIDVRMTEGEPLLLEMDDKIGTAQVSLHDTYRMYMAGGDLNAAVDYLNNIVRNSRIAAEKKDEIEKLDPFYIYPALREEAYAEALRKQAGGLSADRLPGLREMYLEIKDGLTKVITTGMLEMNPDVREEELRKIAYRNLRREGWQEPQMRLPTLLGSCRLEVYMHDTHPAECQFLDPELNKHLGRNPYLVAFTNRKTVMVLRADEAMETLRQAQRLAEESGFRTMAKRSVALMPSPVSDRVYWVRDGKAGLLPPSK